jgi:hypothetical protein
MWCLECVWKRQALAVVIQRIDAQRFQDRKFAIYGYNQFPQTRGWQAKANVAHSATALESKQYSVFILCGHFPIFIAIINNEGQRG